MWNSDGSAKKNFNTVKEEVNVDIVPHPLSLNIQYISVVFTYIKIILLPSILSETSLRTMDPPGGQKVEAPGSATITDSTGYNRDFSSSLKSIGVNVRD